MTSNCLIDGTMTAVFRIENELAVTMMAQRKNQDMKYYQQHKAQQNGWNQHSVAVSYTVASREFVRQIPNTTALKAVVNL